MQKYEELLLSLRRVIRAIDLHSKKLSKETGLTGPQLLAMRAIEEHDGTTVSHVANAINLSSATVTSILDRLESRLLITRTRSTEDKRKVVLHLTDAGKTTLVDAPKPLQDFFLDRFENLEEWEQTQLVAAMQRIAKMMDADELDAAPLLEVGTIQKDK